MDKQGKETVDEKIIAKVTGAKEPLKKRNRGRFEGLEHFAELGGAEMNMIEALLNFRNRPISGENRA